MSQVLAIADDLTGALEAGAKFAARGIPALVSTRVVPGAAHPVMVVDTESRHMDAQRAAAVVSAACEVAGKVLYKKTDSTLRGNIGAELRAMAALCPGRQVVYVPAYPAVGRTVRAGRLYVHGVPVEQSAFAQDALNPIRDGSIAAMLGDLECAICDGETQPDVLAAVAAALGRTPVPILAGPASVADALAQLLESPRQQPPAWPHIAKGLIVNGSRHHISARQVACVEGSGCDPWRVFQPAIPGGLAAEERAAAVGREVAREIEAGGVDGVMVFGGDTAFGILKALGCPPLEPVGEVVTGVPLSRIGGLTLITKAGGFGGEQLIEDVRKALHGT